MTVEEPDKVVVQTEFMAPQVSDEAGQTVAARRSVAVTRLTVTDFRSYSRCVLELDTRPVVLTGDNGAGKTNLLEAISLLSPGRGLRGAPHAEIARQGGPGGWAVAAVLHTAEGPRTVGTGIEPAVEAGRARAVKIDGSPASGPAALGELFHAIWLTPAMDRLFADGAGARRRFLDRLVMGFDRAHAARAAAYERALRERNRLLADDVRDEAWLSALEGQMAEHGVALAAARVEAVARLKGAIDAAGEGAFPRADLALEGTLEAGLGEVTAALDLEDRFQAELAAARPRDRAAGRTLDGPHRTDLLVRHRAKDADARACSTGEQKALLIGLVLANARLLAASDGAAPVLLLDEVAAHLDARRRTALFDQICALGLQAWTTGTDAALFEGLGDRAQYFRVADSVVTRTG